MQVRPEVAFELSPGDGDGIGDVGHSQRLGEVFPHVPQGPCRVDVRQGQHVGALAGDDARGGDQDGLGGGRLAVHEAAEQFGRGAALAEEVWVHAGKRRRGEVALVGVVAVSKDGHLLGHAQADGVTEAADSHGHHVAVCEDAQRQLELGDLPAEPLGKYVGPGPRGKAVKPLNGEQVGLGPEPAGMLDEAQASRFERRRVKLLAMKIGHVPEASLGEMLGRGLTDAPAILNDAAASFGKDRVINLHHRHAHTKEPPYERGLLGRQEKEHAVRVERPRNLHTVKTQVKHTPARPADMVIDATLEGLAFPTKGQQDRAAAGGNVRGGVGGGLGHEAIIDKAASCRNNKPERKGQFHGDARAPMAECIRMPLHAHALRVIRGLVENRSPWSLPVTLPAYHVPQHRTKTAAIPD